MRKELKILSNCEQYAKQTYPIQNICYQPCLSQPNKSKSDFKIKIRDEKSMLQFYQEYTFEMLKKHLNSMTKQDYSQLIFELELAKRISRSKHPNQHLWYIFLINELQQEWERKQPKLLIFYQYFFSIAPILSIIIFLEITLVNLCNDKISK